MDRQHYGKSKCTFHRDELQQPFGWIHPDWDEFSNGSARQPIDAPRPAGQPLDENSIPIEDGKDVDRHTMYLL
ncbi:MAG TPA: hypothetical protein VIZ18_02610 [Ktedonobacteraceae bacterium]